MRPLTSNNHLKVVSPKFVNINSTPKIGGVGKLPDSPHMQTHNFNLMSTIKVTDLKLHLNQNNAETVGAADSHRVFGGEEDRE